MQKAVDLQYYSNKASITINKTQAQITYLRAIQDNPSKGWINHEFARYLADEKNYKEAEFRYKKTSIMMPETTGVYLEWGYLLDIQSKVEGQEEIYRKAIEIDPNYVEGLCNLGAVLAEKGRFEEAIPFYEKTLEIKPNEIYPLNNIASAYLKLGRYNKAVETLQKVLEIDKGFINAHLNLGLVNSCLGKDEEAKENYKNVVELIGNDSDEKEMIRRGCESLLSLTKEGLLGEGTDEEKRGHNERFMKAIRGLTHILEG